MSGGGPVLPEIVGGAESWPGFMATSSLAYGRIVNNQRIWRIEWVMAECMAHPLCRVGARFDQYC